MNPSPDRWKQLVSAAKPSDLGENEAPLGFATRTVALWKDAQRNEQFRLWERWSLRAGAASLALCGILALSSTLSPSPGDAILIPVPSIDFPVS